jgi:hypothetical protein
MATNLNLIMEIANSFVTVGCGAVLFYLVYRGKIERNLFYYGWSLAFILYGLQIFLRSFSASIYAQIPMFLAFVIFFPFSIFLLRPKKSVVMMFSLLFVLGALFTALAYFGVLQINESFWILASTFFYLPVASVIVVHRRLFGSSVDKLLVGWLTLFLVNILLPMGGWAADTLAIFGKLVLLLGIRDYDFAILSQKIRNGLSSSVSSPIAGFGEKGGMEMVVVKQREEPPLRAVTKWLKNRVDQNVDKGVETSVFIMQNVIPFDALRAIVWNMPDRVHVFMFSNDSPPGGKDFTVLKFGLAEIGAAVTEVTRREREIEVVHEIVLVDLSIMIHTFGTEDVYNLLLNKMGALRSSLTYLTAIFHTSTHEDLVVSLFRTLADNITQL